MRQLAWLNTAPDAKPSKSSKPAPPMTRMQALDAAGTTPDLPPSGVAAYLVGHLFDAGPVSHAGMGAVPLGWADLQGWQHATGIELSAWEARGLRRLSAEYIAMQHDARAQDCPPAYAAPPISERRAAVSQALGALFGARSRSQPRKGI